MKRNQFVLRSSLAVPQALSRLDLQLSPNEAMQLVREIAEQLQQEAEDCSAEGVRLSLVGHLEPVHLPKVDLDATQRCLACEFIFIGGWANEECPKCGSGDLAGPAFSLDAFGPGPQDTLVFHWDLRASFQHLRLDAADWAALEQEGNLFIARKLLAEQALGTFYGESTCETLVVRFRDAEAAGGFLQQLAEYLVLQGQPDYLVQVRKPFGMRSTEHIIEQLRALAIACDGEEVPIADGQHLIQVRFSNEADMSEFLHELNALGRDLGGQLAATWSVEE